MEGHKAHPRSSVDDRRTQVRAAKCLHVRYTQEGSPTVNRGTLVDLNNTGAGILTEQPLDVGTRVVLEINSPSGSRARCAAEVLHSRQGEGQSFRAGVLFIDLDEQDTEAISQILQVDIPVKNNPFVPRKIVPKESLSNLPSGLERRRAPRVGIDRSISFKIFGTKGLPEREGVAQLFDLSLNGVGLRTSMAIRQGVSLQLEVVYSGGLRCAIEAECIYCRKDDDENFINGLRFISVERSDLAFFAQLLAG
ncbi:MAG: PilZ domain-containing protein [Planctomycetota bacterium]|nr:PilZ domain-containing protein [Planctomycetota bacterium]